MEYLNALSLSRAETPAPALNRGLALLAVLGNNQKPQSLDNLAGRLQLPKASVFRLLSALQDVGMVRKTPDKCYEPLWTLQPLEDKHALFRQRMEQRMQGLCTRTGCTVEWYEPDPQGMVLVTQVNPNSELHVQARPGFIRSWDDEFEAVARLAYAHDPQAPVIHSIRMYVSNGVLKNVPKKEIERLLKDARRTGTSSDQAYNTNGVRRHAIALIQDKTFYGVLALAEAFHFSEIDRSSDLMDQLNNTRKEL